MKSPVVILAAVLAAAIAAPAAAHVPMHCDASGIRLARVQKIAVAEELIEAAERQDLIAVNKHFGRFLSIDARQLRELGRWTKCVEDQ